jgi:hypothetical protein
MPRRRNGKWTCYILLAAALLLTPAVVSAANDSQSEVQASAQATPQLTTGDCIKCHPEQVKDVQTMGSAHSTEVTCMDCHQGHPPAVADNIPECSNCHDGEAHFKLDGCLSCHTNPHTPLEISLNGEITKPCLTCHTEQISQLQEHQSAHSKFACTTCHEQHGPPPECLNCHQPHLDGQTMADCTSCHKAHMPLQVTYKEDIPSKFCAACHPQVYDQLIASSAKHSKLACAFCHQDKHGTVPQCTDCHGVPHPQGIMAKFTKCGQCHGIAHNLNK